MACREIFEAVACPALLSSATTETSSSRKEVERIWKAISIALPGARLSVVSRGSIPRNCIRIVALPGASLGKKNSPLELVMVTAPCGLICTEANSTGVPLVPHSVTTPLNDA